MCVFQSGNFSSRHGIVECQLFLCHSEHGLFYRSPSDEFNNLYLPLLSDPIGSILSLSVILGIEILIKTTLKQMIRLTNEILVLKQPT
jgi:hypothetical protein